MSIKAHKVAMHKEIHARIVLLQAKGALHEKKTSFIKHQLRLIKRKPDISGSNAKKIKKLTAKLDRLAEKSKKTWKNIKQIHEAGSFGMPHDTGCEPHDRTMLDYLAASSCV